MEQAKALTLVFWDIIKCPVPDGCDPRVILPSIKRLLGNNGYCGPLTVTAIGKLEDVPTDTLKALYSSGIHLTIGPLVLLYEITNKTHESVAPQIQGYLRRKRVNLPHGICLVCRHDPPALGFNNFITHLSNADHKLGLTTTRNTMRRPPVDLSRKEGFSGPLTIIAIGVLADVPTDILRALYSSGITFHIVPYVKRVNLPFGFRNFPCQSFDSFTKHLFGIYHQRKLSDLLLMRSGHCLDAPLREPLEENLEAVTSVYWDIKMRPVPPGCDPHRVGPCIKRFLENKGYSGPLTITAMGALEDVPYDILRGVHSSGIGLDCIPYGFSISLERHIYEFMDWNPPPANVMVISDAKHSASDDVFGLQSKGYNIVEPPCDSHESFFLAGVCVCQCC
ncbi:unnamed protein product [Arabidopsis lyrata]|uniref:NYN domain-containing protein n=1 Tax=Arabidopsis lyrata subsp. lyrata TaxID=81972 RepID=D7KBA1_ARALL|nr:hypothetical protein ARALYDRAFT_887400 [Arabidopsis lyrata subsp. lyrata]CAH8250930.1 unnamed protein product [Arabidopsis lyrata]